MCWALRVHDRQNINGVELRVFMSNLRVGKANAKQTITWRNVCSSALRDKYSDAFIQTVFLSAHCVCLFPLRYIVVNNMGKNLCFY